VPIVRAAKGKAEIKEAPADYCAAILRNTGNGRKISGAIHAYKALKDHEAREKAKAR
jgi:hypothetical protein